MKSIILPAMLLLTTLLFSCKKDNDGAGPEPLPGTNEPVDTAPKDFISMKVNGQFYADSLTEKGFFQNTNVESSMLEIKGRDGGKERSQLYVRINFPGHEIKEGQYAKVKTGLDNAVSWTTFDAEGFGIKGYYYASSNDLKHPDDPFVITLTKVDEQAIEGTFSAARAFGREDNGDWVAKEITEGKFRITRKNITVYHNDVN